MSRCEAQSHRTRTQCHRTRARCPLLRDRLIAFTVVTHEHAQGPGGNARGGAQRGGGGGDGFVQCLFLAATHHSLLRGHMHLHMNICIHICAICMCMYTSVLYEYVCVYSMPLPGGDASFPSERRKQKRRPQAVHFSAGGAMDLLGPSRPSVA